MSGASLLKVEDLTKRYGATVALSSVAMEALPGEVHAILGENGAGKSTLVKILSGAIRRNGGEILLAGKPYQPHSILDARAAGIATAFQELSLLPNLTVAENLLLPKVSGSMFAPAVWRQVLARALSILQRFDATDIDPQCPVDELTLAEKQRVEIVRAFAHSPRVLILDEPTAALPDTEWLFKQIRRVTEAGTAVLYISHRLGEVRELCQRATVLRNGRSIGTVPLVDVNDDEIFRMMVGRSPQSQFPAPRPVAEDSPIVLETRGLSGGRLRGIDFTLRRGEVLGFAGLEGQGQSELFRALAGLNPDVSGEIVVDGNVTALSSPRRALAHDIRIAFVPEERKVEGVFGGLKTAENISLPALARVGQFGFVTSRMDADSIAEAADAVALAERYFGFRMDELSGGNQQKAVLARALMSGARCLVMFDPTRGVDVGTKQAIYALIRRFADEGGAIAVYSSELSELVHLCDRCLVVYRGRIAADFARADLSEENLLSAAHGHATGGRSEAGRMSTRSNAPSFVRALLTNGAVLIAIVYALLFTIYAIEQPSALSAFSIQALLNNSLPLMLAAAGQTFIVLQGGFDLSVAGVISLANVVIAVYPLDGPGGALVNFLMVVAIGLAVGATNGFLVAYLRIQSIAATLGTMIVCQGIALLILKAPGGYVADWIAYELTDSLFGVFPVTALIAIVVCLIWVFFRRLNIGLAIYAVGRDETSAALSGIDVRRTRFAAFCFAGVLYGAAAYMLAAQTATGNPTGGHAVPAALLRGGGVGRHVVLRRQRRRHRLGDRRCDADADAEGTFLHRRLVLLHRRLPGHRHDPLGALRRAGRAPFAQPERPGMTAQPDTEIALTPVDTRTRPRVASSTITTIVIFLLTGILIAGSRVISPAFGSWSQLETILYLSCFLIIVGFGQGLVILVRGLDLSVASVITLGGVLTTIWLNGSNADAWFLLPAVILCCAGVGVLSGIGVSYLKIPPFIMTLAMGIIVYSLCLGYTAGTPRGYSPAFLVTFMHARWLGVPAPICLRPRLRPRRGGAAVLEHARPAALRGRQQSRRRLCRRPSDTRADDQRLRRLRRLRRADRNHARRILERRDAPDGRRLPPAFRGGGGDRRLLHPRRAGELRRHGRRRDPSHHARHASRRARHRRGLEDDHRGRRDHHGPHPPPRAVLRGTPRSVRRRGKGVTMSRTSSRPASADASACITNWTEGAPTTSQSATRRVEAE